MSEIVVARNAMNAVKDIINDLTDRRGLRQAWDSIDGKTQMEIINKWIDIVYEYMY